MSNSTETSREVPMSVKLQRALDGITAELREHFKDQLPALMSRVRDINETSI